MGNRRFALVESSDDKLPPPPSRGLTGDDNKRKCKRVDFPDEEVEEREREEAKLSGQGKEKEKEQSESKSEASSSEGDEESPDAQPIGDVIRVSGKDEEQRHHYESFEYDGLQYHLEDTVLLTPDQKYQKPHVAIIKDITQTWKGDMMVTVQWFYRPEEAEKKGGGNWQSCNKRELYYSFHRDEVGAESVMHNCVVHFIPLNKLIPHRKQHPGFVVQKVYDTEQRRLFKLTDKDYEEKKLHEIDLLVKKTFARIGDLPDLESDADAVDCEDQMKHKRLSRKRSMEPLDVSKEDKVLSRSHQSLKAETPRSTSARASEYFDVLSKFKLLTGVSQRDRCLEKLLQSIQFICTSNGCKQNYGKERDGSDVRRPSNKNGCLNHSDESHDKTQNSNVTFDWPDAVVPAIISLEKAVHNALSADFQKYNQKMRQLIFNLKGNAVLARRLLNRELEPAQILNMSPNELKKGLTAEELASKEPEESGRMQMTDARCLRCEEKQVGLKEIIQAGHDQRYQLECNACGHTWYGSRDDASSLTIEGPSSSKTVGTAPLATAKFEDVEKNLKSPRGGIHAGARQPEIILQNVSLGKARRR